MFLLASFAGNSNLITDDLCTGQRSMTHNHDSCGSDGEFGIYKFIKSKRLLL